MNWEANDEPWDLLFNISAGPYQCVFRNGTNSYKHMSKMFAEQIKPQIGLTPYNVHGFAMGSPKKQTQV